MPSERPQDCSICRQGLTQQSGGVAGDSSSGTGAANGPRCTIPSHFLNAAAVSPAVEAFPSVAPMVTSTTPIPIEDPSLGGVPGNIIPPVKELTPEETFTELVKRLRGLLSRQNVSVDPSIALLMVGTSWMLGDQVSNNNNTSSSSSSESNDLHITVEALMSHPFIGSLKASKETIIRAAEAVGSHVLRVDKEAEKIYPIMKAQRCTLILRNLDCQVDELREFVAQSPALAKYTESEPILEIRKEIVGGQINWFVTLPTAEDTTETALWLRQQKFKEHEIQVGIKSESEFQSFMSRPMPTWNMEGAFIPLVPMHYGPDKGRMRRGSQRGGRPGNRGGRTRGGAHRRNWTQDGVPVVSDGMRHRGGSNRGGGRGGPRSRGGMRRGGGKFADWYEGADRDGGIIVGDGLQDEVDASDFPPLMESAKLSSFGYGGREFKQYSPTTLRELRDRVVHTSATEVAM